MGFQNIRHILHQINTSIMLLKCSSDECGEINTKSKHLNEEIKHLEELVNKMQHLMERSKIRDKEQTIEIEKVLQQTFEIFQPKAGSHKFRYDIDPKCSDTSIKIDQFYLKELLRILLDNAIKHTPEGNNIKLKLHKRYKTTCITIQNEGVSISPEISLELSEGNQKLKNKGPNNGFGLCLARDIATQLNLKFQCQSKQNKYTRFSIQFPPQL